MRVFVYEYLCGGARADSSPSSLHTEGWAMLSAVLEDFARCPGVETVTLIDPVLSPRLQTWNIASRVLQPGTEESSFRALAADCDWTLVIAPEFDDILAERCRWVEDEGGRLLGPSSAAVARTADKLTLARHWNSLGIPTPAPLDPSDPASPLTICFPLVYKPRFGAGSQATFLVSTPEELRRVGDHAAREGWQGEMIAQPYVPGLAASVAFLAGPKQLIALPAVVQHLSSDGRFHYLGGRLPLPEELDLRARRLAERSVRTIDGLHGYFGVDLVLGSAGDGSADAVLEINPRLTTSYIGLRRLARFNLAEALLAVVAGSPLSCWSWRTEHLVFRADGLAEAEPVLVLAPTDKSP
jgi:predicted ATP-grasp superfamily ATP-dependent carboligase